MRKLGQRVGVTYVSSSSNSSSGDELSMVSNEVEQNDSEFAIDYTYTTNVSTQQLKNQENINIFQNFLCSAMAIVTISMEIFEFQKLRLKF